MGGRVWLPLLGRRVVPSAFGERYARGDVVEDGRHLFVRSGVGTSAMPVQFLVPPEIVLLTLRSVLDVTTSRDASDEGLPAEAWRGDYFGCHECPSTQRIQRL